MDNDKAGFTLIEALLTAAIVGLIILGIVQLFPPLTTYFRHSQARQQAQLEARICMETIQRVMSNGRASTLAVSMPATTTPMGSSKAQFTGVDESSYTITWSDTPMNSVHLQKIPAGVGPGSDTVLATHVTGLHFTFDMHDPGIVHVTLEMKVPLDSTGQPGSFYTILLPNQSILMSTS